jgi:hypothetical protein
VAGAGAFGYTTCWCNRLGVPMDRLGVEPDHQVQRLDQIIDRIEDFRPGADRS